jgi:glutamate--cysteine ligase
MARGVQYVEVRCLDINPFLPVGIDLQQSRFLDAFILFCALQESPQLAECECGNASSNFLTVVKEGRRPGLQLNRNTSTIDLKVWAEELLNKIEPISKLLDQSQGIEEHVKSLVVQRSKVRDSSLTPSAQVLASMNEHKEGFTAFSMRQARVHAEHFRGQPLSIEDQTEFETKARESLAQQSELEQTEEVVDFDTFVGAYQASILAISN